MTRFYEGKTILITGAASGIGKDLARKLFPFNTTLILWDIQSTQLHEMKRELFSESSRVTVGRVDQSDGEDLTRAADQLIRTGRNPDLIFHCAGIVVGKRFSEHTPEEIRNSIQVNLESVIQITSRFLPQMLRNGQGAIVPIASASGYIGNPRMSVYASTKWGVIGWAESLRLEMEREETGVRVTTVIPGYVDTGMFRGVKPPLFVPLLKTSDLTDRILNGVASGKRKVEAPFLVRLVPLLRAVLPGKAFDWLAGTVFGVYRSMDTFTGRTPDDSFTSDERPPHGYS